MRIVIDLDGTLCALRKPGENYADLAPLPGAPEKMRELKRAGHHLIIHSARHMKTCNGDVAEVEKRIGDITRTWLQKHQIPYDELVFGKPYGHVYIDDLAVPFRGWDSIPAQAIDAERINIVIPMAGLGSRFTKAGYTTPKPLIDVLGRPMVEWAVETFSSFPGNKHLIFIILQEHATQYQLADKLFQLFGSDIDVIIADHLTRGQAETVALAKHKINNYNRLFIFNCDTYSEIPDLWPHIDTQEPDGTLACFTATDPRYSYAALDEYGYVKKTAEKKVISNYASNGLYYFKHGYYFIEAFEKQLATYQDGRGELYVAPLYNELIRLGKRVSVSLVKNNWVLGTPEELDYFKTYYGK